MIKRVVAFVTVALLAACKPGLPPQELGRYQNSTLYTCCNIHHEGDSINDANYNVGAMIPLGTPVQVQAASGRSVTFTAAGTKLTLAQKYGAEQEPFQQYLDKILVAENPAGRVAGFSPAVQAAIRDGRVEQGMTREQVILSLGYPPTHRTPSTEGRDWTYWYNNWVTYRVIFDDAGVVSTLVGQTVPTQNKPIPKAAPKPTKASKAPAKKKKH